MNEQERKVMKLALEALESCGSGHITDGGKQWFDEKLVDKSYAAIEEVLSQPAVALEQRSVSEHLEPVAWHIAWDITSVRVTPPEEGFEANWIPLYTTPPPVTESHKRKPLTDEQITALWDTRPYFNDFARAIEAAHGIKE